MVDSIGSGGQIPKVPSSDPLQKSSEKKDVKTDSSAVSSTDEVALSEEALDLVNAQKAAEQTSAQLAGDENLTLSSDNDRLNALA